MKWIVLRMPWTKGSPTAPELVAARSYDFEQERRRLLQLIDEFAGKPLDEPWRDSAFLGPMKGREWSRLMAKHVDHHLKQFGASARGGSHDGLLQPWRAEKKRVRPLLFSAGKGV